MLGALGRLVAPDILPLHDLQDHWTRFLDYYSTKSVLTLKENVDTGELGPCLEFFLGQDILNILVTLGQADTPPGIRPIIFKLFIFLLEQVKYPLLYETACHLPLCRLTLLCSLAKASPTESQELDFLTLICDKIQKSPHLVQVFLPEDEKDGSKLGSSRSSRSSSMINLKQVDCLALNVIKALGEVRSKHYLATALLNYLDSPDYFISCRAMQNLINISGLECDESANALLENLVNSINSRVSSLFQSIPVGVEAGRIEELEVNWIQAHKLYSPEFEEEWFPGRSELISFLSFLDFVNNLVVSSHKLIAESIAGEIGRLLIHLYRGILAEETKDKELRCIAYICVTWSHLKSSLLRDHLTRNIFAESEFESSIFNQILEFWSEPGELKIDALRVFDSILSSPHQLFIDCLLGQYLEYRGYCVHNIAEVEASSWSDVEDERSRKISRSKSLSSQPNEDSEDNGKESPESSNLSRTMAPANIHRIVNLWLYLVNDELRLDEFRGSGYDLYIKDAGR
ncbi:protein FAM160B1 isoform X2 [Eurytemora carolleeae]|uniref:protein FAM160B1 isoform X2 n=1 Tax=Eurytemora carolleeae TaxID=1294199 RepID=UPI000C77E36B|nr:protein FAM160B1 isoform X2 [Eurytemora carolleeae]|eukprot:XP_023342087.1 protein FAM160B1-like isoform X2 [Eurytemora affinis]